MADLKQVKEIVVEWNKEYETFVVIYVVKSAHEQLKSGLIKNLVTTFPTLGQELPKGRNFVGGPI